MISNITAIQGLHSRLIFRPYKQVSQIKATDLPAHRLCLPSHFPENQRNNNLRLVGCHFISDSSLSSTLRNYFQQTQEVLLSFRIKIQQVLKCCMLVFFPFNFLQGLRLN